MRYQTAKAKLTMAIRSAPQELGRLLIGSDPYERCNQWLLATAKAYGVCKVHFICLWNGNNGDGRGGTAYMYQEVNRQTGQVIWIDSHVL